MRFVVSALIVNKIADRGVYGIAFTGDGSFTMNPQILEIFVRIILKITFNLVRRIEIAIDFYSFTDPQL